ncbi:MAG: hypothetical protein Q9202_005977 [Teloschistes flavicans]
MAYILQFVPSLSLKSTVLILLAIPIISATKISVDTGFVRDECFARVLVYLANGTLSPNDEVFFRNADGRPMSAPANLTLTLSGCRKLCGLRQKWYADIGERLSVWLLPVLLLISNVELSPLDKRRFSAIIHLVGDPIHSFWSLLDKLDAWDHCYRLAEQFGPKCQCCTRTIATVFAGFEETSGPGTVTRQNLNNLADKYHLTANFGMWRRAALDLADSRTDEFFRTWLAIVLYIYQLIGGFVKEIGGEPSSPPGGRIATSVFLSWLVPVVLLSNAIGNFPSPYTCHNKFYSHRSLVTHMFRVFALVRWHLYFPPLEAPEQRLPSELEKSSVNNFNLNLTNRYRDARRLRHFVESDTERIELPPYMDDGCLYCLAYKRVGQ